MPAPTRKLSPEVERWFFDNCRNSCEPFEFLKFLRYKSLTDLSWLAQAVLGYPDCTDTWHYFLADHFDRKIGKGIVVAGPRNTYKSSFANIARCIQRILRNPDVTILQVGADEGVSGGNCEEIAAKIEDDRFRAIWGDWRDKPWSPSEGRLFVKHRKFKTKNPTVGVGAPGIEKTSKHPDIIVVDDLEARANARSEIKREAALEYFKQMFGLLKHGGEMWIINTPWSHYDNALMFGHVLNPQKRIYEDFDTIVMPLGEIDGIPDVMPDVFTKGEIDFLIRQWGWATVMCQLYLWPVGEDETTFDMSLLDANMVDVLPGLNTWTVVDPSKSKGRTHDPMGVAVLGLDADKNLYILDAFDLHKRPNAACNLAIDAAEKWDCGGISPEEASGVTSYKEIIEECLKERPKTRLVVRHVTTGNREKHGERIDPLMSMWDRGRLKIYSGMDRKHLKRFIRQMRSYPIGDDDMLDCIGYWSDVKRFRPPKPGKEPMSEEEAEKRKLARDEMVFAEEQLVGRNRQRLETAGWIGGLPGRM